MDPTIYWIFWNKIGNVFRISLLCPINDLWWMNAHDFQSWKANCRHLFIIFWFIILYLTLFQLSCAFLLVIFLIYKYYLLIFFHLFCILLDFTSFSTFLCIPPFHVLVWGCDPWSTIKNNGTCIYSTFQHICRIETIDIFFILYNVDPTTPFRFYIN